MITEKRQTTIIERLKKEGAVKVIDLTVLLKTSESTIRRDLKELEEKGYLRRVHGGAVPVTSKISEKSYHEKTTENRVEKEKIAKYAAALVLAGDSIYLDSGTTTFEMIKYLRGKDILVITNGISHINALVEIEIPCILIGGHVKPDTKALVGAYAVKSLAYYRFDKCFIGTNGVHPEYGLTTPNPDEAAIKELAINLAQEAFVLADSSKWGETKLVKFTDFHQVMLITDEAREKADYAGKLHILEVEK